MQWKKTGDSHELVVPANTLWDVGLCHTHCLLTQERQINFEESVGKGKGENQQLEHLTLINAAMIYLIVGDFCIKYTV